MEIQFLLRLVIISIAIKKYGQYSRSCLWSLEGHDLEYCSLGQGEGQGTQEQIAANLDSTLITSMTITSKRNSRIHCKILT